LPEGRAKITPNASRCFGRTRFISRRLATIIAGATEKSFPATAENRLRFWSHGGFY